MSKAELFDRGVQLLRTFCNVNNLVEPPIIERPRQEWSFDACAFYRMTTIEVSGCTLERPRIEICIPKCADIGTAGMQWSYPGYSVDRTPYGVLAHELGHHADVIKGGFGRGYMSMFSKDMRATVKEPPLTSYCPNDGEWFAEMFRLFVTNPDLLLALRPKTFTEICSHFTPVVPLTWEQVLSDAPERTKTACRRKVAA